MNKITAVLERFEENDIQTLGLIKLTCDGCDETLELCSLELPDNENRTNISRIPPGEYLVETRVSAKYGKHFIVRNVPKRHYILIHQGNYHTDTRGCILLGTEFKDIDGDGIPDIKYSKRAMDRLIKFTQWKPFKLIIK